MNNLFSHRLFKFLIVLSAVFGVTVISMKLFALRTYDPANLRSRPNGYLMSHTVTVQKPPKEVFDFITYKMEAYNLSLAKAHDNFYFVKGNAITDGAVFVAEEYQEDEGVKNTYVVQKIIPNQLIYYASTPTLIFEKVKGEWKEKGRCNAHVYFDIVDKSGGTQLVQTIVIEMENFFTKFLIDLIIMGKENNEWMDHLVEELESLKRVIEQQGSSVL